MSGLLGDAWFGERYLTPEEFEAENGIIGSSNIARNANEFIDKAEEHRKKLVKTINSLDKDLADFEKNLHSSLSAEMNKVANLKTAVAAIDKLVQDYRTDVFDEIVKNAQVLISLDTELIHLSENTFRDRAKSALTKIESTLGIVNSSISNIESDITNFKSAITTLQTTTLKTLGEDFGRDLVSNLFLDSKRITDDLDDHFNLLNISRTDIEKHLNLLKPIHSRP